MEDHPLVKITLISVFFRVAKPNIIKIIGITTNGKLIVDGIWKCFETHGLPFDILFEICIQRNYIPDWTLLYNQMINSKMEKERILSKLAEAISDSFGKNFCDEVLKRLEKI